MKRIQNIISESRFTLPVIAVYGAAVWCAAGLLSEHWWVQFACFAASTYLMMELNNSNALIRIYSRMVSCAFIVLSSSVTFMFSSVSQAVAAMCVLASYLLLFRTYQDRTAMGRTFYAYLFIGLGAMAYPETLYFVPALWLLSILCLQAPSWRNFFASVFGLLTPYWFAAVWFIYQEDFTLPMTHFASLAEVCLPPNYSHITLSHALAFIYILIIGLTGIVHYLRTSYNDKIRIRMLYQFFITMNLLSAVLLVIMPQHYDFLLRMMIINTSPLIAHFIALTRTRVTNIAFYVITLSALMLTAYNLWTSSSVLL